MSTAASVGTRPNQRDRILDTALRLMSEHGAKGTTMRQLAAACDLQVAAIYHYFDSKDALLSAVVEERRYGTRTADPFPVDSDACPEDRLRAMFLHVWNAALQEQEIWRLVIGEGMHGEPAVRLVGRSLLDLLEPAVTGWIEQIVPEIADPASIARLMVGQLLIGFVRTMFDHGDPQRIGSECADPLVAVAFG